MPLGIRPTVDFAFKKIFGSPQNSLSLIGLLNAILDLARPVEQVEVLNPFSYQEFADSKLIVLDIRCRDTAGRWLNVEMQVSVFGGLLQRLVYYACSMYVDQLEAGHSYSRATPAISICLLNRRLFADTDQAHHRFCMMDSQSGRELSDAIEVHTVELTKYNLDEATIGAANELERWAFLFLHAHEYDAEQLKSFLPGVEFQQAIGTIETISARTEDRQMYDQREKAQRDYEWAISGAREEGVEEGVERGVEMGVEMGVLIGRIQMLQEVLGMSVSSDAELRSQDVNTLADLLSTLRQSARTREA